MVTLYLTCIRLTDPPIGDRLLRAMERPIETQSTTPRDRLLEKLKGIDPETITELSFSTQKGGISPDVSGFADHFRDHFHDRGPRQQ